MEKIIEEIVFDARELEAPEPFRQACSILSKLTKNQSLKMLHRRIPHPLIELAQKRGLDCQTTKQNDESYVITFRHKV